MCICFDDSPIPDDPKSFRPNTFQITMMDTLTVNQPVCCLTYFLPCCCAYYTRYRVLDSNLSRYTCCQGYLDNPCFHAGCLGEQSCPEFCLACETFWCLGPSMSSSRMFMMDQYDLRPDPIDNQIVRFTNCIMCLSCVCDILSIFVREIRHAAHLLHTIANCVFYTTIGCMASQVNKEVDYRRSSHQDYSQLSVGEAYAPVHGYQAPIVSQPLPDNIKEI